MKILMTGATGMIGQELGIELVRRGHALVVVSRDAAKAKIDLPFPCEIIEGDLMKGPLQNAGLSDIEGVIHLAGENLAGGRWTEGRKRRLFDSRVEGTKHLRESLKRSGNRKLHVVVSTSATGFYGDRGDEELNESSPAGKGFLSEICQAWEREAFHFLEDFPELRLAVLRLGVVLSPFGGALPKMLLPFRFGAGAALGSGRQWISWIHLEDAVRLFAWAVETEAAEGIFNGVAPHPVRNVEFSWELAAALRGGLFPAIPKFALKAALGEMSETVLDSCKVFPERTLEADFKFLHPELQSVTSEVTGLFGAGGSVLRVRQYLPVPRAQVFPFFSEAKNLERITPPFLNFHIEKMSTAEIKKGTLIDYRLRLRGFPLKWQTRIEEWQPPERFVDIQLKGPYRQWHHTHVFEDLGPGVLVTDEVRYEIPLRLLGQAAAGWFVSRDVHKIFNFRRKTIADHDFTAKNRDEA